MTEAQLGYYDKMVAKDRLVPVFAGDKLRGVITFYIGSDAAKYVRDDPWTVLEDEPQTGTVCFIDQLISNHDKDNARWSFNVWHQFKQHIRETYPKVRVIRWNRYKNGEVYVFHSRITPEAV